MHFTTSLIHALPTSERRVFSRDEAASYVGVSPGHFKKLVDDGIMPGPLAAFGRICRWDRAALDRALDGASGTTGPTTTVSDPYEAWRNSRGQG